MKKIIIIGGGIAGITAGIFAQENGFDSIMLEKHHTVGGECTGWDRQGYHIDGCIHWRLAPRKEPPAESFFCISIRVARIAGEWVIYVNLKGAD